METRDRVRSRFERFVLKDQDSCWEWIGYISPHGYGMFGVHRGGKWQKIGAHRISYELYVGPIPDGLQIDHLCRNRKCVNPKHIEAVTKRENLVRGLTVAARAKNTHCIRGHAFDGLNTRIRTNGTRSCRACVKVRHGPFTPPKETT